MAKYGSDDAFILVDGYDLSGETIELSQSEETLDEETHGFGDKWTEVAGTGVFRGDLTQRAFYDDAARSTEAAFVDHVGENQVLIAGVEGNEKGRDAVCFFGSVQRNVARQPERGLFTKIAAAYRSSGPVDEAIIIQSLGDHPAVGAGVAPDGSIRLGDATANGGRLYIAVTDIDLRGGSDIEIKVQHSSDNGATDPWADLGPAASIRSAPFAAALEFTGSVEEFVRVYISPSGTGAGATITAIVALKRD